VVSSVHDNGVVLFDTVNGGLYASNLTGALIWEALDGGLSVDSIAADLTHRYRIPYEIAAADTRQFLAELETQRLVTRSSARSRGYSRPLD
jgi:hypothetical protein